ncbi:MAG: DNA-binding response OmpR family regulator/tRNA A-37 threonylcarbamoyl transferase component Bud32 [Gammaproteobacteria bacterium]|jgi:DNA-binding response OmpR family regulator/tRNA A-37 threonylcarbamoyl transferase component Bud32
MALNILIIDDSVDFRALLGVYIKKEFPNDRIEEYEFDKLGRPPDNYDWTRYDLLLLDYKLGEHEDGLEWLKIFRNKPGFPPTIILTAEGDEYVAVKAVKLGAAEYINKKDISPKRLKELIDEALEFNEEKEIEQVAILNDATQIIQKIKSEKEKVPEQDLNAGYRFVRLIGQGGMSKVYLAERTGDSQSLVLKIIDLSDVNDEKLVARFLQEAELIAELHTPFVIKIFEYGLTNNYGFIAMEFFPRGDLKQRMELNLTPEVALNYMTHVSYGLDAIHSIGVVHRDLKPANIMFRGDDSLAIADFGISKRIEGSSSMTTIGQIIGTPHYMSPEQAEGIPVDHRCDIYSAGVMIFEFLAGQKPYTAMTPAALIYQHVHADIPQLPENLSQYQEIIDKTMAKSPLDRYQSAKELIDVLEQAEKDFS